VARARERGRRARPRRLKPMPTYNTFKRRVLLVGDFVSIVLSFYLSFLMRSDSLVASDRRIFKVLFAAAFYVVFFYIFDLYNLTHRIRSTAYMAKYLVTVAAATALITIVYFFVPGLELWRGLFLVNALVLVCVIYLWHLLFSLLFENLTNPKNVVIIGAGSSGQALCTVLKRHPADFNVVGYLDDRPDLQQRRVGGEMVIGTSATLATLAERMAVDEAVLAVSQARSRGLLQAVIHAKMTGIEIADMPTLYEELTGKLPLEHMDPDWIAHTTLKGVAKSWYTLHLKRVIDMALSLFGLVVTLPLTALVAVAIKLDSPGPVLYRHDRVGLNENLFELLKFRSMTQNAEPQGAVWAQPDDPRVTRVGAFIRRTRVDEIPQMWNVLRGEMSFLGPRPERPEFVEQLKLELPYYSFRHSIKPGITGWAQVMYPYGASTSDAFEKLQYDLYYLKNLSSILDFQILLRTIRVVLFGEGAR
jgi:sugar transferase (PEP-CTERM system associated)